MARILPVIVFMLGFLLIPKYAVGQENCDDPPPTGFVCGGWGNISVTRQFPNTYGCTIIFKYSQRICIDNSCGYAKSIVQYRLVSIDIPDNCTTLMNQLYPGYPDNWGGTINEPFFNDLVDGIFLQLGKEAFVQDPAFMFPCSGTPPNCDMPTSFCDNKFQITYSLQKCRAYCIQIENFVGTKGYKNTSITPITCQTQLSTACCQHVKYFCNCGGDILVNEINTYSQGNCNALHEPRNLCPTIQGYTKTYINCGTSCE